MQKPQRFYVYCNKLYFTYKMKYDIWLNSHFENKPWHIWEEWSVGFGIADKWFGIEDTYYDGHTCKGIIFMKLIAFKMYTYQSEEMK